MDEKMLLQAIREIVKAEIEPLNGRMDSIEERMDGMEKHMDSMEKRIDARIDRLEILLEHEIPGQLQLLAEGHQVLVKRLPEEHELGELRSRVSTLEHISADHSEDIRILKQAN